MSLLLEASCLAQENSLNFQLMVASRSKDAATIIKCLNGGAQMNSDAGVNLLL